MHTCIQENDTTILGASFLKYFANKLQIEPSDCLVAVRKCNDLIGQQQAECAWFAPVYDIAHRHEWEGQDLSKSRGVKILE